jgi:hypothetical protein
MSTIPGPTAFLALGRPWSDHDYRGVNGPRRAVEQFNAKIVLSFASYLKVDTNYHLLLPVEQRTISKHGNFGQSTLKPRRG